MDKKFVWTEKYSVGSEAIDEQHQTFFGIANELEELADNGATGKGALLDTAARLGDYAFYHFDTEEELFRKFDFPGAVEHVAAHNSFRGESKKLIDSIRESENAGEMSKKTADFAGNWLMNHILVMDRKYAEFFKEKGVGW